MSHFRTTAAGGSNTAIIGQYVTEQPNKGNGVSYMGYQGNSTLAALPTASKIEDCKDGVSQTIMFAENVQAGPWHRVGFVNQPGDTDTLYTLDAANELDTNTSVALLSRIQLAKYSTGIVWHFEDPNAAQVTGLVPATNPAQPAGVNPVYEVHKINGGGQAAGQDILTLDMDTSNCFDLARPSSIHPGGANIVMVDRSTKFLVESIDYRVYQALLTMRGKSSYVPWPEFVISDELDD